MSRVNLAQHCKSTFSQYIQNILQGRSKSPSL